MKWSINLCRGGVTKTVLVVVVLLLEIIGSRRDFIGGGGWALATNLNMFSEVPQQFKGIDGSEDTFGNDDDDIFPVAYYDVNADKLTDMIAVNRDRTAIDIFFAWDQPPYLRRAFHSDNLTKDYKDKRIVSVRPGDFTGNGVADLMVVLGKDHFTYEDYQSGNDTAVDLLFCLIRVGNDPYNVNTFECDVGPGGKIKGVTQEPMVLDLNGDMVLDLIGEQWIVERNKTAKKKRMVWISEATRDNFEWNLSPFSVIGDHRETIRDMMNVSSNAFGDIDGDNIPELIILTQEDRNVSTDKAVYFLETYEVIKDSDMKTTFQFKKPPEWVRTDTGNQIQVIGQPMLVDFQHKGKLEHLLPYCTNFQCTTFGIAVMYQENLSEPVKILPLPLGAVTYEGLQWSLLHPEVPPTSRHPGNITSAFPMEKFYSRSLSLRVGDYNLDGYPDLLGVLRTVTESPQKKNTRAVVFENVPCNPAPESPCSYERTFVANFEMFKDYRDVISASFYDIGENGALDVFLVTMDRPEQAPQTQRFIVKAFENDMNFDASFLKVMVLSGQECEKCTGGIPYGNVLPGASVRYHSLNTHGFDESGVIVQTYRTAHMPLDLPCNVFGIGHSPNFIDTLTVSIAPSKEQLHQRSWKQIIPNSQIVVVPRPLDNPGKWTMKLFLTPSDIVLKTFAILVGVCMVLATLAAGLEYKERREDRKARQNEAYRMVVWLS